MNRASVGLISVLVLFCGCAIGCSGTLQKPTASFRSASVGEVSATGFTLNADVDLKNPNSVALPLSGADYSLGLGGVKVVDSGKVKLAERSIPANGSTVVTIPVPVTFENLLAAEESITPAKASFSTQTTSWAGGSG